MINDNLIKELPFAITVCDKDGKIIVMNDKSIKTFEKYGGQKLIGQSLFGCHPGESGVKLASLLSSGEVNCYTIEKAGIHKMIYQSPWFENGSYMGFVELSLQIPSEVPHFVRS
ncbi:MAG TPA: diguanylate cyclase [Bacteroidales bacterium]